MHNRSAVNLSSMNDVVNCADDGYSTKHDDTVIHELDWWVVEQREEAHDCLLNAVQNGDDIDWNALRMSAAEQTCDGDNLQPCRARKAKMEAVRRTYGATAHS